MIHGEPSLPLSVPAVCRRPLELCPVGACQPCDTLRRHDNSDVQSFNLERNVDAPIWGNWSWFARGIPAVLLSLALTSSAFAGATDTTAPAAPKKPRAKPAVSISVKVYPNKGLKLGEVKISAADADSCVAWVGADNDALLVRALQECRAEIAKKEGTR